MQPSQLLPQFLSWAPVAGLALAWALYVVVGTRLLRGVGRVQPYL